MTNKKLNGLKNDVKTLLSNWGSDIDPAYTSMGICFNFSI